MIPSTHFPLREKKSCLLRTSWSRRTALHSSVLLKIGAAFFAESDIGIRSARFLPIMTISSMVPSAVIRLLTLIPGTDDDAKISNKSGRPWNSFPISRSTTSNLRIWKFLRAARCNGTDRSWSTMSIKVLFASSWSMLRNSPSIVVKFKPLHGPLVWTKLDCDESAHWCIHLFCSFGSSKERSKSVLWSWLMVTGQGCCGCVLDLFGEVNTYL